MRDFDSHFCKAQRNVNYLFWIALVVWISCAAGGFYLLYLVIRALLKYING